MSERKPLLAWTGVGIGVFLVGVAAAHAVFWAVADVTCDADDCYGENGFLPLATLVGVLVVTLYTVTRLASTRPAAPHRSHVSRWLGVALIALAIPTAVVSTLIVAARYCPSGGCGGDYIVMAFAALLAALLVGVTVLAVGIRLLMAGRRWSAPRDRVPL
jgi:hypothetical protein